MWNTVHVRPKGDLQPSWKLLRIILPSLQLNDCLPESGGSRQTLTQANVANRLQTAVSFQDPVTSLRIQGAKNHFHTV